MSVFKKLVPLRKIISKINTNMDEIKERINSIIVEKLGVEEDEVNETAMFMEDLGADSLDMVELIMEFEKTFEISISDEVAESIKSVGDVYDCIEELKKV